MTAPLPTRQQIDAAGDMEWTARRPARQELTIAITAVVNGYSCEITFSGQIEQLDALTRRLRELGAEPATQDRVTSTMSKSTENGYRKPATRVQPAYNDAGEACCPVHRKALKEGNWGLYCSAKDKETGEYCKLKFE